MPGAGFGSLVIAPDRVFRVALLVIALLIGASVAGQYLKYFLGHDHVFGLVRLTYLNGEATIPSWYSSSALLACAGVLAVIGAVKRARADAYTWYWFGLAAIFLYLSID